ncbi:hypothetical protein VTI74DRAFT_4082 [Chaetomium olivicolor]
MANTVYVATGTNSGLGLGMVKTFLSGLNTTVIGTVRNAAASETLKSEAASVHAATTAACTLFKLDFPNAVPAEKIRETFAAACPDVGHVDVYVNNAGFSTPMAAVALVSASDMRAAYETNTIAPLLVFHAFRPLLPNIGGMEPVPGGAYGPSKAALNYLTKAIHVQEEASDMVAVALHPGWVQMRNGHFVAKEWGYEPGPPVTVEDSVKGMVSIIDGATRESFSGQLVTMTGQILPW